MKIRTNRRQFLKQAGWAAAGLGAAGVSAPVQAAWFKRQAGGKPANDKLNIGVIGTANRATANIKGISGENVVAICDVDENFLNAAAQRFPKARKFTDFRRLLSRNDIDAVVISTPDHTHAVATLMALKEGKHVYCEKPLAHTVSEARLVRETAHGKALATQMGNQIHAGTNYRRAAELIQTGAIGAVSEVHVWVDRVWTPQPHPIEIVPVPPHLAYDLWLGPVQYRPYHPSYLPRVWRGWWAFGGGTLGDFGCHYMDLPHWALDLGHPATVEAEGP
ncbi:MAG: Gfo/Idh/MocA family oxidoreductase, partial [Pedosphaera parvula]|nr:Gfo/Idh/MocA family oxidoreductase [Pedosphaera parvula]